MGSPTFGSRATAADSAEGLLELEREDGRGGRFEELDGLTGRVLVGALRGGRPLSVAGANPRSRGRPGVLSVATASAEQRAMLDELFSVEGQQGRGNWSLPDAVTAKVGVVHFAANLERHGRFAHSTTVEDRYKVSPAGCPDALYYHAVLEPLFGSVYEPFALRGEQTAKMGRDTQIRRWRAVDEFFAALGFDVSGELSAMRYGGGWSRLLAAEQVEAKRRLLGALRAQVSSDMARRHRAYRLLPLIARYYKRADPAGRALRQRVLTRELERTVTAYFGGGWLDFLDYLGEAPYPDEHIATALPEAKLYLGATRKAAEALGVEGLDEEQLRLITASLYGGETSPVERRVAAMERYWEVFDAAHARQESGMDPLWGLVSEGRRVALGATSDGPYRRGLYERLLPRELLSEIEDAWGSKMLPRNPERIVTEPFPHAAMAEAFGPALKFWHGCALTAWFLCEGPYSRTDLPGIESYHRRELDALGDLGTPVDAGLFAELVAAERRLGPPLPLHQDRIDLGSGLTLEMSFSGGSRREGFEILRDVITRHRRAWAKTHLRSYLSRRAERDVRGTAEAYHRMTHGRSGNAPKARLFAKTAAGPTNRWFGGDVSALYRAFGERSPVFPERARLVPEDTRAFVRAVYFALGGTEERPDRSGTEPERADAAFARAQKNRGALGLAQQALEYKQLEEVMGRPPSLKEFGRSKFGRRSHELLAQDPEAAYLAFESLVADAVRSLGSPRAHIEPIVGAPRSEPTAEGLTPTTVPPVDRDPQERRDSATPHGPNGRNRSAVRPEGPRRRWWQRLFGR